MKWRLNMKKIKDFAEKDRLQQPLLVKECKNGTTSKGAPYLNLVLQDSSGTIDGKFWDVKPSDAEKITVGRISLFSFEVLLYNRNLQLRINRADEIDEDSLDLSEFVIASDVSESERREKLQLYLDMIENPILKELTTGMLEKTGEKYFTYPAASRIHHSFLGGLSEHSLSMAELCLTVCEHYPWLNRDLMLAGALIHDIGKTAEMSGAVTTEYTLEGKLEGHISLANGWLSETASRLGYEDTEEAILLHHIILSHHGHYEYGSPVLPMLMEAEALSLIDNLDARMNTLKAAMENVKPGELTSRLFALDNRQFYKPKG